MNKRHIYGLYIPRYNKRSLFCLIFKNHWDVMQCSYYSIPGLAEKYGDLSDFQIKTVNQFINCLNIRKGFAYVECPKCHTTYIVPFSCKKHKICPSCRQKKVLEFSEWLDQEVLLDLTHRHWVLTIPEVLRRHFFNDRYMLNRFIETGCRLLMGAYKKQAVRDYHLDRKEIKNIYPGIIGVLQTFGSNCCFNPHGHFLSIHGVLMPDGDGGMNYKVVNFLPYREMRIAWRNRVLNLLYNYKKITSEEREGYKRRYPKGFDVNGEITRRMR